MATHFAELKWPNGGVVTLQRFGISDFFSAFLQRQIYLKPF